jgi:hypothetical protein
MSWLNPTTWAVFNRNSSSESPEVLAARDALETAKKEADVKVKAAEEALAAAEKTASTAAATPPVTPGTATLGGRHRKTRRSKKSKRTRTGRKSSHP